MAQTSTVSGTVFAEDNNEPIIGASVLVKGTTLGAVTDIEGKFTILNVPGTAKTVIVSFVGMQKVEAAIKPAMKVVYVHSNSPTVAILPMKSLPQS